jgi:hypothetical protein
MRRRRRAGGRAQPDRRGRTTLLEVNNQSRGPTYWPTTISDISNDQKMGLLYRAKTAKKQAPFVIHE